MSLRVITLVASLAACGPSVAGGQPPAKADPPKPLPKEVVAAWTGAGAEVGWMRADRFGLLRVVPEKDGKDGDLPAFKIAPWKDSLLPKLPAPAVAFGLDLFGSEVK